MAVLWTDKEGTHPPPPTVFLLLYLILLLQQLASRTFRLLLYWNLNLKLGARVDLRLLTLLAVVVCK